MSGIPVTVPYRELAEEQPPRRFPIDQRPACCHCGDTLTEWHFNTYLRIWELWSERGIYVNVCDANPGAGHEIEEESNP